MAFPVEDKLIAEESESVARSLPHADPTASSAGNEDTRTIVVPQEEKQLPLNDGKSEHEDQVVLILNDSDVPKMDSGSSEHLEDGIVFPPRSLGHFPTKPITEDKNFGAFPFKPKPFPQEKVKFPILPLNKLKSKWLPQSDAVISRREDTGSSPNLFDPSMLLNRASSLLRRSLSKALPLQGFGSKFQETVIFPILDDSSPMVSSSDNPPSASKTSNILPPSLSSLLLVPPFSSLSSLLSNAVEQPQVTPKPLFAPESRSMFAPESRSESRQMPYTFHAQSPPLSPNTWAPSFMAPPPPPSYFSPHTSFHYYPPPPPFTHHPYSMHMSPYTAHPFHMPPPQFMQVHMNPFMPLPSHPPWQYAHPPPMSPFSHHSQFSHPPPQFLEFHQPSSSHNGPTFRPPMPPPLPPPHMNAFMPHQPAPENRAHVPDNGPLSGAQEIQIPIEIPISIPIPDRGPSREPMFRSENNPNMMTEEIIIIPREENGYMSVPPDSLPYKVDGANEDAYILLYPSEDGSFSLKPPSPVMPRPRQSSARQFGGPQKMSPRKIKMLRDMLLSKAIRNDDERRQGSIAMPFFQRPTRMRQVVRETRIFTNLRPALLPQFQPSSENQEEETFHAPIFRSRGL